MKQRKVWRYCPGCAAYTAHTRYRQWGTTHEVCDTAGCPLPCRMHGTGDAEIKRAFNSTDAQRARIDAHWDRRAAEKGYER